VTVQHERLSERIADLVRAVSVGERHPPFICVATYLDAVPVILEGNKRASAYVRVLPADEPIATMVGVSGEVSAMVFF
jgi:hypothetical protein